MTFVRPTLTELIARGAADIDARLPGADSRLRRSVLDVLVRTHAGAVDGVYGALVYLSRQLMPDTAEAEYLDRWATIWGVTRKAAAPAAGSVIVTGIVGAIVPTGSELVRIDGARFRTDARTVLTGTPAVVPVTAIAAGAAGVSAAGTVLTFASPVSGVGATAAAVDGLGGGADQESDAAVLARLLTRIRTPPNGGAADDWVAWALELPAATRAWAYPNWTGPGTVGLTFVCDGRTNILPLAADLDAMAAVIEPLRPVAATPVIFAPAALPVDLLISATPDKPEVRAAIEAELNDLFRREAQPGGTLYLSRINEAVSLAAGEYDHVVRAPAANIVAPAGYMPMLHAVNWS